MSQSKINVLLQAFHQGMKEKQTSKSKAFSTHTSLVRQRHQILLWYLNLCSDKNGEIALKTYWQALISAYAKECAMADCQWEVHFQISPGENV